MNRLRGKKLLKYLAISKPPTYTKSRLPRRTGQSATLLISYSRNIGQVYIVSGGISILAEYRVNSLSKLGIIRFINIIGINPEVKQAVALYLIRIEADLIITSFILSSIAYQILEGNLFSI
jgi:hypothetical protein